MYSFLSQNSACKLCTEDIQGFTLFSHILIFTLALNEHSYVACFLWYLLAIEAVLSIILFFIAGPIDLIDFQGPMGLIFFFKAIFEKKILFFFCPRWSRFVITTKVTVRIRTISELRNNVMKVYFRNSILKSFKVF